MKDESFSTEIGLDLALTELVLLISLIFSRFNAIFLFVSI